MNNIAQKELSSGLFGCDSGHSGRTRGFTLVEMMVAVGIFAVIMMIAVGGFLSLLEANYKARATKVVVNNLHFAFENMTRNLRTGYGYHCDFTVDTASEPRSKPRDCSEGALSISFRNKDGDSVVYKLKSTLNLDGKIIEGVIERSTDNGAIFVPLTSPEITVESLLFFVANSSNANNDKSQPIVRILANGVMKGKGKVPSEFTIETLVSQRLLDVER